jgi:mannose-6-phosphate isomerase-like protein (cupin superfamily)
MTRFIFPTKARAERHDVIAADGSEVRILVAASRASMIHVTLAPGAVSRAIAHRTVEEVWYVIAGAGRFWRRLADRDEVTELAPGVSIAIPTGTHFQFRADGDLPLETVAATMPPWPGDGEAYEVAGLWEPTV